MRHTINNVLGSFHVKARASDSDTAAKALAHGGNGGILADTFYSCATLKKTNISILR